jgi:biopolymer transport protein ExbD
VKIPIQLQKKPRIEMLPLIDIVFLLLVFFIYAMLSMAVHRGMDVHLPVADSTQPETRFEITVSLMENGSVFVNREPVAPDRLSSHLLRLAANKEKAGVLVAADRSVSYQRIFRLLDQVRKSGISDISLQAEPDESQ